MGLSTSSKEVGFNADFTASLRPIGEDSEQRRDLLEGVYTQLGSDYRK